MILLLMGRDDFAASVRSIMAKRAGYRCSKPSCRALTVGPSSESLESVASIGVAAHIHAAAPGGPRFDPTMTREQRVSIDNGIWLCATHAALIDRDVARFPAQVLHTWKSQHEAYVREIVGEGEVRLAAVRLGGDQISDGAARIAMEREAGWEYKLLNQMLRDEILVSHHGVRDLRYRIKTRPVRSIRLRELVAELKRTNELAETLIDSITQLLGPAFTDAVGPPGVPGDPDAIAYVAKRLGVVYKSVVDNGLQWLHVCCDWDKDNTVVQSAAKYLSGFASAIEHFSGQIDRAIHEAMTNVAREHARTEIAVNIDISEDASALRAQLERITEYLSIHGWPDD